MKSLLVILIALGIVVGHKYKVTLVDLKHPDLVFSTSNDYLYYDSDHSKVKVSLDEVSKAINSTKTPTEFSVLFDSSFQDGVMGSVITWDAKGSFHGLVSNLFLTKSNELMQINLRKNYNKKNLKTVVFHESLPLEKKMDISMYATEEQLSGTATKSSTSTEEVKEEPSFLKKYFWYISIGVLLVMNLLNQGAPNPEENKNEAGNTHVAPR